MFATIVLIHENTMIYILFHCINLCGVCMGLWKETKISKENEYWTCILGLHLMRLVKKGYTRFEIEENDKEVIIKALKSRKAKGEENA